MPTREKMSAMQVSEDNLQTLISISGLERGVAERILQRAANIEHAAGLALAAAERGGGRAASSYEEEDFSEATIQENIEQIIMPVFVEENINSIINSPDEINKIADRIARMKKCRSGNTETIEKVARNEIQIIQK